MRLTRNEAEALVMRIQDEFLETPGLQLTIPQAGQHFGLDGVVCEPVLRVLADARVLAVTPEGAFTRFFPPPPSRNEPYRTDVA
jgi:hypothetical protein